MLPKKKKKNSTVYQRDDHGVFSTPQGHQTLIKWWPVSMIGTKAETVSLETEVQKKFYNYMTFGLGLQGLLSYPRTADEGTLCEKAWKVPTNTEPLELQTQESSCQAASGMTAKALETWMERTWSKNSTRAGRPWHMSGSGVTRRWLSEGEVATFSSFIVSLHMSLSLCLFLSSFFFYRKWSGRQVPIRIHSYPKRNCRYWDS